MNQKTAELVPGQIARIRQRTYLIEEIVKPRRVADSTLVRLSCVDDDKVLTNLFSVVGSLNSKLKTSSMFTCIHVIYFKA